MPSSADPLQVARADVETILVVEDEVLIRWVVAEYLRECGYQVIEAADAGEAVKLLRTAATEVDLVFSDVQLGDGLDGHAGGLGARAPAGRAGAADVRRRRLGPAGGGGVCRERVRAEAVPPRRTLGADAPVDGGPDEAPAGC